MAARAPVRYRFGPFIFEPDERRLLHGRVPLDLTPKALDVLTVLVERHGHLVTKDELLTRVWPDAVVEENVVSVNVSRLRAALGEAAHEGRYIETVPRSGYRFVSDIETVPVSEVVEEATVTRRTRTRVLIEETDTGWGAPVLAVTFAALAVAVVALGVVALRDAPAASPAVAPPPSITVEALPPPTSRALARAAYERGRTAWWTRRAPTGSPPEEQFRLALHHDPSFAPAYVGLASVFAFEYRTAAEVYALTDHALALDPALSTAYATRGFARMMQEWDWAAGEADLHRALALDPDDVSALQWLATLRMIQRRPEEADTLLRRAIAVAPPEARASLLADRAQALYYARAYESAIAAHRHARTLDPGFVMGQSYVVMALLALDRPWEAAEISAALVPVPLGAHVRLREAAAESTAAYLRQLIALADPTPSLHNSSALAKLHAATGEYETALHFLERAAAVRDFHLPFVNADPVFEPLRSDPRFQALLRSMGLDTARRERAG